MPDFESFRSFGEIPGITWESPVALSVGPPLTTAHPLIERESDGFTFVRWVDEHGQRLPDQFGFESPASSLGRSSQNRDSTAAVVSRAANALSVPGTRRDYFEVIEPTMFSLWYLSDGDPSRNSAFT